MKTLKSILVISMLILSGTLISQSEGVIKGTVVDEATNSPMPFVPVAIMQDSVIMYSIQTDVNGEFSIKNIIPGNYKARAFYTGYNTPEIDKINVNPNQTREITLKMSLSLKDLPAIVITANFVEPAFDAQMVTVTSISHNQIDHIAVGRTDINNIITVLTPAVLQDKDGHSIHVRGSRSGSTAYYVDGVRMIGPAEVPGLALGGIDVITGGMPAQYGDCNGGVVVITTKDYRTEMNRRKNEISDRKESDLEEKKK